MSDKRPPVVATWLLMVLGRREHLESLAGDLWEEYQQRPSRIWYWHQALTSIAVGAKGNFLMKHLSRAMQLLGVALLLSAFLLSNLLILGQQVGRGALVVLGVLFMATGHFASRWSRRRPGSSSA